MQINLIRSSAKIFLSRGLGALITFLGITVFARTLGAANLGVFFLFQASLGVLIFPADFGVRRAIEKRLSEGETTGIISTAILLKLIFLLVTSTIIIFFKTSVNKYLGANLSEILILALVIQELSLLNLSILRGNFKVEETALLEFSQKFIWLVGGGLLVFVGFEVRAPIYSLIFGFAAMWFLGICMIRAHLERPSFEAVKSIFSFSSYNIVSQISGYSYNWLDIILIGFFLTEAHVGAYEAAWRITTVVLLLSNAIATTVFPQMSKWDAKDSMKEIEDLIPSLVTPSLVLVLPALIGVLLLSKNILEVIFGHEFIIAWMALIILMVDKIFQSIHLIFGRILTAIDQPNLSAKATLIALFLNFVLNIVFIREFGLAGAAAATTIAYLVDTALHIKYLSKFIEIRFPMQEVIWCMGSSLVMGVLLMLFKSSFEISSFVDLGAVVMLGVATYFGLLLMSESIRGRFSQGIKHIV